MSDTLLEAFRSPGGDEVLQALVTYIHDVSETPVDGLRQVMARLGPEAEEVYVTTADMLRAEGEARGEARGMAKGRAEALTQLLTLKFGELPDPVLGAIRAASVEQLQDWTRRVLTASALDEIFA